MGRLKLLLLLFCLTGPSLAADDVFYLSGTLLDNPKSFLLNLKDFIQNRYEADHPTDMSRSLIRTMECNPKSDITLPSTYKRQFTICMDLFSLALNTGSGWIEVQTKDHLDRAIELNGPATYVGVDMYFPSSLSSSFVLQGTYWYLPNFRVGDDDLSEQIEASSILEQKFYYQKRITGSAWSWRLGQYAQTFPIPVNHSDSIIVALADVRPVVHTQAGALVGMKWVPNRADGGKHFLSFDLISLAYTDSRSTPNLADSYLLQLNYRWYLFKNLALTFSGEVEHFYNRHDHEISSSLWALGIQTFLL